MTATINTLSENTLRLLYEQFRRLRAQVWNIQQQLPAVVAPRSPPSCYLALTDSSGIPERTESATVQTPGVGNVTLYNISDTEKLAYTDITLEVYNTRGEAIPPDTFVLISREWLSGKYIVHNLDPGFGCIRGQLTSAMTSSDSSKTMDNIVVLWGADPRDDPEDTEETVTCSNSLYGGAGPDDAEFLAVWDGAEWVFISGHHEALDVITAWRVDDKKLQYKTRSVAVMINGDETDWIDAHTGTETCP